MGSSSENIRQDRPPRARGGNCAGPSGKVLFVATVARHILAFHVPFIRLLQSWGCEVHVACNPVGEADAIRGLGVVLWEMPFSRVPWAPANLRAFRKLCFLLKQHPYSLVHVHTPVAAFLARLAARLTGAGPVLYTAHGFHFFRGAPFLNWILYYPAERLCARWTDGLIVMNSEDYAMACKLLGDRDRVFFVHGVGVPVERFEAKLPASEREEIKGELGVPERARVAVVIGELTGTKNQEQILSAWPLVLKAVPHACLLVVGDGSRRGYLQRLSRRLGVEDRVKFLGFRNDVERIIALAEVVILTSRREGLPRAILEAMATGKPVVATDVRGTRELVVHGKTGFLVEVGDIEATAEYIVRLFTDPGLAAGMCALAHERIEPYALEKVLREMKEIYMAYLWR